MSIANLAQAVERVFSSLPGTPSPTVRDDIQQLRFDALSALGELVSDSPIRQLLVKDFQVATVGGVADLNTSTLVGGGSLASGNVFHLIADTIKRSKAIHPDSVEPIMWEKGNTIHVAHPKRDKTFGYVYGTIAANSIVLFKEDGTVVSDQPNLIFRSSFAPTLDFFAGTSPTIQQLEEHLILVWTRLVSGGAAQSAGAAAQ